MARWSRRLVDLLVTFADATGTTVVAEGVETESEAAVLRASGTHLLQGYLFGKPSLEVDIGSIRSQKTVVALASVPGRVA